MTKEIDEDLDGIKDAVGNYQRKLKDAVAGIESNEGTQIVPKAQQFGIKHGEVTVKISGVDNR